MKIIFLHIPKAGGTTIHSIINRCYSPKEIHNIIIQKGRLTIQEFIELDVEAKNEINILKGHLVFGLHESFPNPRDVKYITYLRNPVDRIISQFKYIHKMPNHYLYEKVKSSGISAVDFALSDWSIELDNGQVRLISGFNPVELNVIRNEHLEIARSNLKSHFIFTGILENFDDSLLLMKEKLNWESLPYYRKLNVTEEKIILSDKDRKAIEERNKYDMELYRFAKENFELELSKIKDLDFKRDALKSANEAMGFGFKTGFELGVKSVETRYSRIDKLTKWMRKK